MQRIVNGRSSDTGTTLHDFSHERNRCGPLARLARRGRSSSTAIFEGARPMSPAATVQSIGQILIAVSEVDRAVAFYRDKVGLTFLFQFPGMAFFDCGGVLLYLDKPDKPEFSGKSPLYFRVPDI